MVKKLIRKTKKMHYKEHFEDGNTKNMWQEINQLLGRNPKIQEIEELIIANKIIKKPEHICKEMNQHFTGVAQKFTQNIPFVKSYEEQVHPRSMYLETGLENISQDLEEIIDNLNSRKARGFNDINVKLIKCLKVPLLPILSFLTKQSLNYGIFPSKMKIAKVTPVFKTGNRTDPNNYRPISVLPVLSKIIEKFINNKLIKFLLNENLLSASQYGFRIFRDTEVAMADIVTDIQKKVDENKKCCLVSLDLRKAFDMVNPYFLLKLNFITMGLGEIFIN